MNDLSREARALIEDARPAERPDVSAKDRVRAALAVQLSLPPGHPPQAPAAPRVPPAVSAAGAGVATKLVLVCALTTTAVVGGVGVRRWIASSGSAQRADQTSLRPAASLQAPPLPNEALPPASPAIPSAGPQSDISPASIPLDRSRTPALHRSPNQNPVARSTSLPRRREQGEPAERFVLAQDEPRGGTPFLPSAPRARTREVNDTAGVPTFAASGEVPRGAPVAHAGARSVPMKPPTTAPPASPRTRELDDAGAGGPSLTVQRSGESVSRSLPARHKTGCSGKEELQLLGAAQIALREGRAKVALAMLDRHTALCPSARFFEEHSAAHILALCLLHQRERALAEATQLATLAPTSPQLARLRTSCAAAGVEKAAHDKGRP